jgi:hypothetical protein
MGNKMKYKSQWEIDANYIKDSIQHRVARCIADGKQDFEIRGFINTWMYRFVDWGLIREYRVDAEDFQKGVVTFRTVYEELSFPIIEKEVTALGAHDND